jgi:hypothetical protein
MSADRAAPVIALTQMVVEPAVTDTVLTACRDLPVATRTPVVARALYVSPNRDRVLALEGYESLAAVHTTDDTCWGRGFRQRVAGLLGRDLRTSLLGLEEVVKPSSSSVPSARRLQVRYIEVPPRLGDEYRAWRAKTIFPYVRSRAEVDAFKAYVSCVSEAPGVYFLSESSCEREDYLAAFATPAYQAIVAEAGARYIADGVAGLKTEEWTLAVAREAGRDG